MNYVKTITFSDVEPQEIKFLWEPFIAFGTITTLAGHGGEGKSFAALAIAADVSAGRKLPGNKEALPPMNVILQNAENARRSVLVPRLKMLGADCSRIHTIDSDEEHLSLTDDRLEQAIIQHNARLLIADPIQAHLPSGASMNRAESVRPMLMHLAKLAERTNAAILLVAHFTKGGEARNRILGSVEMSNAVPNVLYLAKVSEDSDERAIVHHKSNLAAQGQSQAFILNKEEGFRWIGECNITVDELLGGTSTGSKILKTEEATAFLGDVLSDGDMNAADIIELAESQGISKITLERAKRIVGVQSIRIDGRWIWKLRE